MGCCISKFSPKREDFKQVEDPQEKYCYAPEKLFMSRCPSRVSPLLVPDKNRFNPIPVPDKFIHISDKLPPPSPQVKLASFSPNVHPSTTSNSSLTSSTSSLSTASSISESKERSFSNDFLRACYQENSHVARISSLRESSLSLKNGHPNRSNSPVKPNRYSTTPNRAIATPERGTYGSKRTREPSPNHRALTRQKSFRKDQERVIMSSSSSLTKGKFLKSPSPSRRYEGTFLKSPSPSRRYEGFLKSPSPSRRFGMAEGDLKVTSLSTSLRKDSLDLSRLKTFPRNNRSETRIHRIGSKINTTTIKEVVESHMETDVPMFEEIGNPLIDLDCFIFL
ncbi:F242 protein [Hirschfeldia incana]|nr:F242 protein [Hirschfeldia incana]